MRTTLKRGIGRGAEVNGNGHAVLPPGALTPVTLYRQPPPPQRGAGGAGRPLLRLAACTVLDVVVVGVVGGFYLWAHESAAALQAALIGAKRPQTRLDSTRAKRRRSRSCSATTTAPATAALPSRSDTMMLIRADPVTNTISMLSFPRDLERPDLLPGQGGGADVGYGTAGSTAPTPTAARRARSRRCGT